VSGGSRAALVCYVSRMSASTPACPICRKEARPRNENGAFPFCYPRCKVVDLGKWLDEAYRVPVLDSSTDSSGASSTERGPLEDPS